MPSVFPLIVAVLVGGLFGYLVGWLWGKSKLSASNASLEAERANIESLNVRVSDLNSKLDGERTSTGKLITELAVMEKTLEKERASFQEQKELLGQAEKILKDAFGSLAAEALAGNSTEFLKLATNVLKTQQEKASGDLDLKKQEVDGLVKPISESLARFQKQVNDLEISREGAYKGLLTQVEILTGSQKELKSETTRLVSALKTPAQRGRWGEVQLKNVVKLAGMVEKCDFDLQKSYDTEEGKLRPDMTVNLPGGRQIVVDSKVSLAAYLDAMDIEDNAQRALKLQDHAKQIRNHLKLLSSKAYWSQLPCTPEFVIAFLPEEGFFSAALQQDPSLIEFGAEQRVILATPTTLIALLMAVAYGWRQEQLTKNAEEIRSLGESLYERLSVLVSHLASLRKNLDGSVGAFNKVVGTMDGRVMVTVRKFRELGAAGGDEIETIDPIEKEPREFAEEGPSFSFDEVELKVDRIAAVASNDEELPTKE